MTGKFTLAASNSTPERHPADQGRSQGSGWFVVTQVKAQRVVYFTDDPQYEPPMEGDWYFVSHFVGDLPPGMTLRNCWGWRFNGGVFEDARDPEQKPPLARLLESNRGALLGLLREKIDFARAELAPTCTLGDEARRLKLEEARGFREHRDGGNGAGRFPLLQAVAVARNTSLEEAAALVEAKDCATRDMLEATEQVREHYVQAILRAGTQEDLVRLRRELLDDVLPSLSKDLAFPAKVMEPEDWDRPLRDDHRVHEVTRLQVQLRELINSRRARVRSHYLEDETLMRHKTRLAQAVLSNAGKPDGLDCPLLDSYARAHRLSLVDAARLVLGTVTEAEQVLVRTELLKDSMLARIESIATLRDLRTVSRELSALAEDGAQPAAADVPWRA